MNKLISDCFCFNDPILFSSLEKFQNFKSVVEPGLRNLNIELDRSLTDGYCGSAALACRRRAAFTSTEL